MAARGAGHLVFMSSLAGKAASAGQLGLLGDEVRPARLRARRCARTCAPPASASRRLPGLHPRRRACSPTRASAAAGRRHEDPRARSPRRSSRAIERDRAEVDVAPLPLRLGAAAAGVVPGGGRRAAPARRPSDRTLVRARAAVEALAECVASARSRSTWRPLTGYRHAELHRFLSAGGEAERHGVTLRIGVVDVRHLPLGATISARAAGDREPPAARSG